MTRIELVHFRGCPHVESARRNLRRALERFDGEVEWTEVDLDAPAVPAHARGLPSPTILVRGRDVSGAGPAAGGRACRAAGAPDVETILEALRHAG